MILVVKTNSKILHEEEFVKPILKIINENFEVKSYFKLDKIKNDKYKKIIICGSSLKDQFFLNEPEKFEYLLKLGVPTLAIGNSSILVAKFFNGTIDRKLKIGLEYLNFKREFLGVHGKIRAFIVSNHLIKEIPKFKTICKKGKYGYAFYNKKENIYVLNFFPEVRQKEMIEFFTKCQ